MITNALIVEDHFSARTALSEIVTKLNTSMKVTAVSSLAEAHTSLKVQRIDLALLDINLPDGSGINLIAIIREMYPSCCVVMSTVYNNSEMLFSALRQGTNGYLLKQDSPKIIVDALNGILLGNPPLSPYMAQRMVRYFHPEQNQIKPHLTQREAEVLSLLANGYHRGEISQSLEITRNTVSDHIKQIYVKLDVNTCAQATLKAVNMGLVDPASH